MYVCGIEDAQYKDEKIHFWDDVYGFDMRFEVFSSNPCHESVRPYFFNVLVMPVLAIATRVMFDSCCVLPKA
jgi:hypothetical protein